MGLTLADIKNIFNKRLILNIIAVLNGILLLVFFEYLCPVVKNGFFCGDPSLSLNYKGDTIPNLLLFGTIVLLGLIIWVVELSCACLHKSDENPWKYNEVCCKSSLLTIDYFFGWLITAVLSAMLKVTSGELRPHFFETCQPHSALNCTKGAFISDFFCTNHQYNSKFHKNTITAFPSGHAAFSFYTTIFIIWYLQRRTREVRAKFLVPVIQLILLLWPIFCSVSRVFDHRHHFRDVIAGAIIGITAAVFTCVVICKNFSIFNCGKDADTSSYTSIKRVEEVTQHVEIELEDKEDMTQHVEVDIDEKDEATQHIDVETEDKEEGSLHDATFQDAHEAHPEPSVAVTSTPVATEVSEKKE